MKLGGAVAAYSTDPWYSAIAGGALIVPSTTTTDGVAQSRAVEKQSLNIESSSACCIHACVPVLRIRACRPVWRWQRPRRLFGRMNTLLATRIRREVVERFLVFLNIQAQRARRKSRREKWGGG